MKDESTRDVEINSMLKDLVFADFTKKSSVNRVTLIIRQIICDTVEKVYKSEASAAGLDEFAKIIIDLLDYFDDNCKIDFKDIEDTHIKAEKIVKEEIKTSGNIRVEQFNEGDIDQILELHSQFEKKMCNGHINNKAYNENTDKMLRIITSNVCFDVYPMILKCNPEVLDGAIALIASLLLLIKTMDNAIADGKVFTVG